MDVPDLLMLPLGEGFAETYWRVIKEVTSRRSRLWVNYTTANKSQPEVEIIHPKHNERRSIMDRRGGASSTKETREKKRQGGEVLCNVSKVLPM